MRRSPPHHIERDGGTATLPVARFLGPIEGNRPGSDIGRIDGAGKTDWSRVGAVRRTGVPGQRAKKLPSVIGRSTTRHIDGDGDHHLFALAGAASDGVGADTMVPLTATKLAVTVLLASIVTWHAPAPVQAPLQELNV